MDNQGYILETNYSACCCCNETEQLWFSERVQATKAALKKIKSFRKKGIYSNFDVVIYSANLTDFLCSNYTKCHIIFECHNKSL